MSQILKRFILSKHRGYTHLELRHDTGVAERELVCEWPREVIEEMAKAEKTPDPVAVDVVAEVLAEAQAFTDALANGTQLFRVMAVRKTHESQQADTRGIASIISSRPLRVFPSEGARAPGANVVDAHSFDRLCNALLEANKHVIESSRAVSEGAAKLVRAQAEVLDALSKVARGGLGIDSTPVSHVLTDEEREEVVNRTALVRTAMHELPKLVDLGVALAAKFARLPTVDEQSNGISQ